MPIPNLSGSFSATRSGHSSGERGLTCVALWERVELIRQPALKSPFDLIELPNPAVVHPLRFKVSNRKLPPKSSEHAHH